MLPAYRVNPMLDLSPISNALTGYQQQMNTNDQLNMQQKRLDMETERFQDQKRDSVRQRLGNVALLTLQEADPTRRAQKWQQVIQTHPEAATLDAKYHDPSVGPMAVLGDAKMAQDYLNYQLQKAAEGRANAQLGLARNADARASAESTARLSQDSALPFKERIKRAETYFTPEERTQTNPRYAQFLNTGQLSAPADPYKVLKEGETIVSMPRQPGQKPTALYPENPTNNADRKFTEKTAELQAADFAETVKQHPIADMNIRKIQIMKQLSSQIGQPGIGNTLLRSPIGSAARAVGIAPQSMANVEAFTAMIDQMVPQQRPPGSGTMSDKDVMLFKGSLPQLAATKEGRDFLLGMMEGVQRYEVERAKIANEAMTGRLSRSQATDALLRIPNPLAGIEERLSRLGIGAASQPGASASGPAPGTIEQGYRFRGGDASKPENWEKVQ